MKKPLSLVKSSLHDIRCCDETPVTVVDGVTLGWRAQSQSLTCVLNNADTNTGYVHVETLEQYNVATGQPTGVTKPNSISDPDYIADYPDTTMCAISQPQPSYGYATINNYVTCKGYVEIVSIENTSFIVPNIHTSINMPAGTTLLKVTTYAVNDNTVPIPCTVEINGLLQPSEGYVEIPNVTTPFVLNIRAVDYNP